MTAAVALVGAGRMGGPMVGHLVRAGHDVRVFDIDPVACAAATAAGARVVESPAAAADGAVFVSIVVFDGAQVVDVLTGPQGMLPALPTGAVVAVHTTVMLGTVRELVATAAPHGVDVIDAGISGGEPGAQRGTLLTMVGGEASTFERTRPFMEAFSKEVIHAGPIGAGMALKLARNAAGYAMMAAVHEALAVATRAGIGADVLRHTIAETGVLEQSLTSFTIGGPDPLEADAPAAQRQAMEHLDRLAAKDLDAMFDLADSLDVHVDAMRAVRAMFSRVARL